ncbi:TPA: hypothetical protein ACQJWR_001872 [Raoultella ornithinolytica]
MSQNFSKLLGFWFSAYASQENRRRRKPGKYPRQPCVGGAGPLLILILHAPARPPQACPQYNVPLDSHLAP